MRTILGTALAGLLLAATPAGAGDAVKGPITVTGAWARATPAQAQVGAAFLTVANTGTEIDRLVAANAKVSKTVELHLHTEADGVMRMRPVEALDVRPGQSVTLEPGGLHIMLVGLNAPLKQGDSFPLTLVFQNAGDVTVTAEVQAIGAMAPGGMMMQHDPKLHEEHMKDPAHREMHEKMHGKGN